MSLKLLCENKKNKNIYLLFKLLFNLFIMSSFSSSSPSNNNNNNELFNKVQLALQYHKKGDFNNAILYYEDVIPFLNGKLVTQLCNNLGAIYLQQGILVILFLDYDDYDYFR